MRPIRFRPTEPIFSAASPASGFLRAWHFTCPAHLLVCFGHRTIGSDTAFLAAFGAGRTGGGGGDCWAVPVSGIPGGRAYWSPYQKLEVLAHGDSEYSILVNNTGYMNIANMTPEFLGRNPAVADHYKDESSYDAPFRFARNVDRVLIVGAGAGNDAAAALRNQAKQVDAVEIDPVILALGKQLHPEGPYRNPAVHQILNDARAFLRQSKEKYDVIVFGLLDSHTQFSDYSNMRVDNYVIPKKPSGAPAVF